MKEVDFLSEVMAGFLQDLQGDQAYWQGKAKELMKVILSQLVYMRNHKDLYPDLKKISVGKIKEYLNLAKLVELLDDPNLPAYDENNYPVKKRLENFLAPLAPLEYIKTINSPKPVQTVSEAIRQFGFYKQQWNEPLKLISGVFGNSDINVRAVIDVIKQQGPHKTFTGTVSERQNQKETTCPLSLSIPLQDTHKRHAERNKRRTCPFCIQH